MDTGRPNGLFVGRLCPHYVVGQPCPHHVLFGHDDDVNSLTVPSRHRQSSTPVCVVARKPQFWSGTLSRHRRNKGMVSVVAEKEFRIPNTKYTFPINAGHTGRRLSHGKAIVRFIRFVLLSICFKRQRWSIPPNWRTATPRWRKLRSHGCAP